MRHLFTILAVLLCASTNYGQTIKSLGFNSTNGNVVTGTNILTFTNIGVTFDQTTARTSVVSSQLFIADGATLFFDGEGSDSFREAIGLGGNPTNTGGSPVVGTAYVYAAWGLWDTAEGGAIGWRVEDSDIFIGSAMDTTNAPTNTTNAVRWLKVMSGTNSYRVPLYK